MCTARLPLSLSSLALRHMRSEWRPPHRILHHRPSQRPIHWRRQQVPAIRAAHHILRPKELNRVHHLPPCWPRAAPVIRPRHPHLIKGVDRVKLLPVRAEAAACRAGAPRVCARRRAVHERVGLVHLMTWAHARPAAPLVWPPPKIEWVRLVHLTPRPRAATCRPRPPSVRPETRTQWVWLPLLTMRPHAAPCWPARPPRVLAGGRRRRDR